MGALISDRGRSVSGVSGIHLRVREKEKELEDLEEEIISKRKEVEELRKNLTIELMLKGKVDKTDLRANEEELDAMIKEKEELKSSIKDLQAEIRVDMPPPVEKAEKEEMEVDIGETFAEVIGNGIDMRMVRDLMPADTEEEAVEKDDTVENRIHVRKLKDELDRNRVAEDVRREAYGGKEAPASESVSPRIKRRPIRKAEPTGDRIRPVPKRRTIRKPGIKKVQRKDEKEVLLIIRRALALLRSGELEDAKTILETALEEDPNNDEILYHLGNVYFVLEDLETAEFLFERSIRNNPRSYRAYNNLGVIQKKQDKRESAIRSLNRSIELEPGYGFAWMNLGTLFMEMDPPMLTEASIFLKRALECQPNYRRAREKLDICREMMEQE